MNALQREAERQAQLLRALLADEPRSALAPWVAPGFERGFEAYRANAGALAERALGAAFPTVAALVGEASFAALARAFWHRHPPLQGDVATWGEALADFIAADAQLADEPTLPDMARLEWLLHRAESAPDDEAPATGLALLAETEPQALRLRLRAGTALLRSAFPLVTLWNAHQRRAGPQTGAQTGAQTEAERFAPVRAALAAGRGETALVQRVGWRAVPRVLALDEAGFVEALLAGHSLGAALESAGEAFDFETWLLAALRSQAIAAVAVAP